MKHYIIAKFRGDVAYREELLDRIREIFALSDTIPGVHGTTVLSNCVRRENRYDVMIVIDMDEDALTEYDASDMHRCWKSEFGPLLESKAIFDHL